MPAIDVTANGGVILGPNVICDGFRYGLPYRVQTHIHDDHMDDFSSSKQFQEILCSDATRDLLIADLNADLKYRVNLIGLPFGTPTQLPTGDVVTLVDSGHMLGSAQVLVERPGEPVMGYSGDFQWPITNPIQVDALVIDSTYGSPNSVREFTQIDANFRFAELVISLLKHGPVHITGFRGTIQRAVQILAGQISAPIVASKILCNNVEVFRQFGCAFDPILPMGSAAATEAIKSRRYVRIYSKGDPLPEIGKEPKIRLSAYMSDPKDPIRKWNDYSYSVALSDHADFWGTLEYIRATGATYVVADNSRGHGVELAIEIQRRLGITAVPSTNSGDREWGL